MKWLRALWSLKSYNHLHVSLAPTTDSWVTAWRGPYPGLDQTLCCQSWLDAAHWYRLLVNQSYIYYCFDCSSKLVRNFDQQFTSVAPCKRLLSIEISQSASTYLNTVPCYREYSQYHLCKINRRMKTLMKSTYQLLNDNGESYQRNAAHLGVASIRHYKIVWVDSYRSSATAITTMPEQCLWI